MNFPLTINLWGLRLPAHPVFESAGYFVGARLYFARRKRVARVTMTTDQVIGLLIGCFAGAWVGSKLLGWAEMPVYYLAAARDNWMAGFGGKTIVGGLLGGWAGIEVAKRRMGIAASTGDAFVWPLAIGTAIGRLGCFFTGLPDHTYGIATILPWGVDFGDGIRRHPTQLYESVFVLILAVAIEFSGRHRTQPAGARFRLYIAGYLLFRFLIEFIKPRELLLPPLSAIQIASLLGCCFALFSRNRLPWTAPISSSN